MLPEDGDTLLYVFDEDDSDLLGVEYVPWLEDCCDGVLTVPWLPL